jgi:tetratricopeptide (TPR) repeat protein
VVLGVLERNKGMDMKKSVLLVLVLISSIVYSQDKKKDERIKEISTDSCDCIANIDLNLDKDEKAQKIKDCITGSIMAFQLQDQLSGLLEKTKDTLNKIDDISKIDTLSIDSNLNIVLDDTENYKEVEEYLYDNCSEMKKIYFVDNKAYKNSYSDHKKAMEFYKEGQVAFAKEEYPNAIVLFNKAVKKDKNFAFAWDNLGYSYRRLGNYTKAIECYQKSLALDPKGKMPLMNIAVAYQLNNDLESAKQAYENFKLFYNDDPEAFYGLGRIYYLDKDYEPALENMIQAYLLYTKMESPYNIDAQKHIAFIYNIYKDQDNLDEFYKITKKYNLEINGED